MAGRPARWVAYTGAVLILDCYNLLHTTMPQPLAGLDERGLIALLAAGQSRRRGRGWGAVRIVCDGVEKPHAPTTLSVSDVELVYAGPGVTADEVIVNMIEADTSPRQLVVVSNDRQIQKAATRRRARAMSCESFIGELARMAGLLSRPIRGDAPLPTDADYWMREFGLAEADSQTHPPPRSNVTGWQPSLGATGTALWRRCDGIGTDVARLVSAHGGWDMSGVAVFVDDGRPCRLEYMVHCNAAWRTERAAVKGYVVSRAVALDLAADEQRRWTLNGRSAPQLDGCHDIDLAFTPATNTLPLRRLGLDVGDVGRTRVAWLRFPELDLAPLEQTYQRLTDDTFRFTAAAVSFTADLRVHPSGLVTLYPGLWEVVSLMVQ